MNTIAIKNFSHPVTQEATKAGVIPNVCLMTPGPALGHGLYADEETVAQFVIAANEEEARRKGVKSRFTHPGMSDDGLANFVGKFRNIRFADGKAFGDLHISDMADRSPSGKLGEYIAGRAKEAPESFGTSAVLDGGIKAIWLDREGKESESKPETPLYKYPVIRFTDETAVTAVDFVDEPALNPNGVFGFSNSPRGTSHLAEFFFSQLDQLCQQKGVTPHDLITDEALFTEIQSVGRPIALAKGHKEDYPTKFLAQYTAWREAHPWQAPQTGEIPMSKQNTAQSAPSEDQDGEINAWEDATRQTRINTFKKTIIEASNLPPVAKDRLHKQCHAGQFNSPEELTAAIESEREYITKLNATLGVEPPDFGTPHPRDKRPRFSNMFTGFDQVKLAAEALLNGDMPPQGVRPLADLGELYTLLSGDYDKRGVFDPNRVAFAEANTTTLSEIIADVTNKKMHDYFDMRMRDPKLNWWHPLITQQNTTDLNPVYWDTLYNVQDIARVAEGATYQEVQWGSDQETAEFVKDGNYLGISLETMWRGAAGTALVRKMPRALARAAFSSYKKSLTALLAGVGPTLNDGTALFAVSRGNLVTTALSHAAFVTGRIAMAGVSAPVATGQTTDKLGEENTPQFIYTSRTQENTAFQILATEMVPGSSSFAQNIFASGDTAAERTKEAYRRIRIDDNMSDTNDWILFADHMLSPVLGTAFLFGRDKPDIIVAAGENNGLMFTNDTLPIKVRWFYANGIMDWRGAYKGQVAGG